MSDFSHAGRMALLHQAKRFVMTALDASGPSKVGKLVATWCASKTERYTESSTLRYALLSLAETGDLNIDSTGIVTPSKPVPPRVRVA